MVGMKFTYGGNDVGHLILTELYPRDVERFKW